MYAVGDMVREKMQGLVGEVVEVRDRGADSSYTVWCPATGRLEVAPSGDDLEPASPASGLRAAAEHLARARDELRNAGMHDMAETVAALLAEISCDADAAAALEAGPGEEKHD